MDFIKRFFELEERNSTVGVEVIAGLTTFLSMAYIIFVNPDILSNAGMDKSALVIATCLAAAFGSIITGLFAKTPIAMAPGMGLNAFFAYTLVITNKIAWPTALGIVFLSGLVFLILSVTGVRKKVVDAIPSAVINATSVGIGLFITFIGLKNLGLVVGCKPTLVKMGELSGPVLIGLYGLLLIIFLEIMKVKGSILIGIAVSTVVGLVTGYAKPPTALENLNINIAPVFLKLDIVGALKWSFIGSIFSLMFVDMFDSVGTIVACSKEAKLVDEDGSIKKLSAMLTLDAVATMFGALLGTSTTTSYIESGTGIEAGGRTGLTAVITGLMFVAAIVFTPLIAVVPGFATAPALIIVGLFMMRQIKDIDFSTLGKAFPAFITIVMMPLTYSISTGLAFGFISWTLIKLVSGKSKDVGLVMWIVTALSVLSLVLGA